jgi:hypothetical protein
MLSRRQWGDLALMCKILRPFSDVIRDWEGEKYVTLSRVWPFAWSLQQALEKNVLSGTNISQADRLPAWSTVTQARFPASFALRRALRSELGKQERFGSISMVMKLATALDPRTKELDCFGDSQRALVRDALIDAVRDLGSSNVVADEAGEEEAEDGLGEGTEASFVPILSALLPSQKKRKRRHESSIADEVDRYFDENGAADDPLAWWKRKEALFPRLARLARKYLALPASSAPSERIFSKMNAVVDKRRASLDSDRVERLVFIKENKAKVSL